MCTIVDLEATKKAKKDRLNYAWRIHKIIVGCRFSPIFSRYAIQPINRTFFNFSLANGSLLGKGAFHCMRSRRLARKMLKKMSKKSGKFVIEKVYFKPQDIVAVGDNELFWKERLDMEQETNYHICVKRFVLNEKDR